MNTKKLKHSKWYERMRQDLQLQSLAPKTQDSYVYAVRRLAEFYDKSPARITEEELCQYFLHRANVDQWSRSACSVALSGIKRFYRDTLNRKWTRAKLIKPKRKKTLPVVISAEEVRRVLKCMHPFRHYAALATIYSCGLRVSEALQLQIPDLQNKRGYVHIRGKGSRDRCVPIPPRTLEILRMHWKTHRNGVWLFPAPGHSGRGEATAKTPLLVPTFRDVLRAAVPKAKVHPKTRPHTFRHCYATHLLEQGVDIRVIQQLLGHASLATTMIYTKLTEPALKPATKVINEFMNDI
ncbi:MAG: tyrosine-type recombinase/integrase [Aestuariibacter sp.]|nr:tyrosine-type recombinase/integrase [Aestuariibacter sp.]